MAKIVRYNGKTMTYLMCDAPTRLVPGREYEVLGEESLKGQTNYILAGVEGKFNAGWFDEVPSPSTFIAISNKVPVVGERCSCLEIDIIKGEVSLSACFTSPVKEVIGMGNNIYSVMTQNSHYIIKVEKKV